MPRDRLPLIAYAGIALIALGCFTPLARMGMAGNVTFYGGGAGDGPYILALMLVSAFLTYAGRYRLLAATAAATAVIVLLRFRDLCDLASAPREPYSLPLDFTWGWAPSLAGIVLLAAASVIGWRKKRPPSGTSADGG